MTSVHGDHVPALHNSGPGPMAVYRTSAVGSVATLSVAAVLKVAWSIPAVARALRAVDARGWGTQSNWGPVPAGDVVALATALETMLRAPNGRRAPTGALGRSAPDAATPGTPQGTPHGTSRGPSHGPPHRGDSEDDAVAALAQLSLQLTQLGALRPVVGLVTAAPHPGGATDLARAMRAMRKETALAAVDPFIPVMPHQLPVRLAWCVAALSHVAPPLLLWSRPTTLTWWRHETVLQFRRFGIAPTTPGAIT